MSKELSNGYGMLEQVVRDDKVGVLLTDPELNIIRVNDAICSITGYTRQALQGCSFRLLFPSDDVFTAFKTAIKKAKEQHSIALRCPIKCSNGIIIELHTTGDTLDDNETVWLLHEHDKLVKSEKAIRDIISAVYTHDNVPYMEAMVLQLAKTLEADFTFIGELQPGRLSVQTLALCAHGKIVPNFIYALKDTPCEIVHDGKITSYPSNVANTFPKDRLLKEMQIEGYVGIPLFDAQQETFGIIVALYHHPIEERDFAETTMHLFANQVANEIARVRAEKQLHDERQYLQSIIDGVSDSIMVISEDFTVQLMNKTASEQTRKVPLTDSEHPKCYEILHQGTNPCNSTEHRCPISEVVETKQSVVVTHEHQDDAGNTVQIEITTTPLWNREGAFIGVVEASRDITTHVMMQDELRLLDRQAHHDGLTGLPNRLLFYDRLSQAVKQSDRDKTKVAVMFIDLDHFKQINDTCGHQCGDEVLKVTAKRLHEHMREIDTLSRFGGDEFTAILEGITERRDVDAIVMKLMQAATEPLEYQGKTFHITLSLGVTLYPDDTRTLDGLVEHADAAMYQAKKAGRNCFRFFSKSTD